MRHDFVQTLNSLLDDLDLDQLTTQFANLAGQGGALLNDTSVSFVDRKTWFELDMSYLGQTHTVDVPLFLSEDFNINRDQISAAFETRYKSVFGNPLSGIPCGSSISGSR